MPKILHSGRDVLNTSLLHGVSVDETATLIVLNITVMKSNVGIYECSTGNDDDKGCNMRFCLSTGEQVNILLYTIYLVCRDKGNVLSIAVSSLISFAIEKGDNNIAAIDISAFCC